MAISNVTVVDTTSKYIVKSTGIGSETDQELVDAKELTGGTNESKVSLIECFYLIEGTGTLTISTTSESADLEKVHVLKTYRFVITRIKPHFL